MINDSGTIYPLSQSSASTMAALVYECGGNAYVSAGMAQDADGRRVLDITNDGQRMVRYKQGMPVSEFVKELKRFGQRQDGQPLRFKRETLMVYDDAIVPTRYDRGVWAFIEIVAYSKTTFSVSTTGYTIAAGKAHSFLAFYGRKAGEAGYLTPIIKTGDAGCLVTYGAAATGVDPEPTGRPR